VEKSLKYLFTREQKGREGRVKGWGNESPNTWVTCIKVEEGRVAENLRMGGHTIQGQGRQLLAVEDSKQGGKKSQTKRSRQQREGKIPPSPRIRSRLGTRGTYLTNNQIIRRQIADARKPFHSNKPALPTAARSVKQTRLRTGRTPRGLRGENSLIAKSYEKNRRTGGNAVRHELVRFGDGRQSCKTFPPDPLLAGRGPGLQNSKTGGGGKTKERE